MLDGIHPCKSCGTPTVKQRVICFSCENLLDAPPDSQALTAYTLALVGLPLILLCGVGLLLEVATVVLGSTALQRLPPKPLWVDRETARAAVLIGSVTLGIPVVLALVNLVRG